jgi:YD repeat-containing protein
MKHDAVCAMLAAIALAFTPCSKAEVSLKNGNFFDGTKDVTLPGGFEPKIERVYNSKTSFKGMFGYGWGIEYEVYLETEGDGSVLVHEYGGGAENLFVPPAMSESDLNAAVDSITAVAKAQGDVSGDENLAAYRKRLLTDASFRQGQWNTYVKKSLLKPAVLVPGTRLLSNRFSYQVITVLRDGYRRDFDNGRVELFRQDGKLRQITDKNGNYITFSYDVPGQIAIRDNYGRTMILNLNDRALVTRVDVSDGRSAQYRYNDWDELIYAADVDGNVYQYEYDAGRRHNMTKITYSDKTTMEISYYPREQFENVHTVKDRDGTLTEYAYDIDKNDSRHYTVTVKVFAEPEKNAQQRKIISTSSYEYLNKAKQDGEEYTAEMITTIDGDRTDTTYNLNGLPLKIQTDQGTTTFAYDARGHVILKTTPTEKTELAYDPAVNKVTWVRITDLSSGTVTSESKFTYDAKGNLLTASSGKTTVTLKYDANGRIAELDPSSGGDITFAYNDNSKPISITVLAHNGDDGKPVAEQSITVTYSSSGEIQKVDSAGGRAAALEITKAFQSLLDLIRPAGVTLSF